MSPENTSDKKQVDEFSIDPMPDEIIVEFLTESKEGLDGIEGDFITLEEDPGNMDILNNIFRIFHSMKGASSFIGFHNLENVSHKTEDLLNKLRKSELSLSSDIMDTLLNAVDTIKLILKDIEENRKDSSVDSSDIISRLLASAVNTDSDQKPSADKRSGTSKSAVEKETGPADNRSGNEVSTNDHIEILTDMISPNIIDDFLEESYEGLQKLEVCFVALEQDPGNKELLNDIFRVIHSIKGSAALLGFRNLEGLAHKAEDVLNKSRKGEMLITSPVMDALLKAVDIIKTLLKNIEKNKKDTAVSTEEIKNILESVAAGPAPELPEAGKKEQDENVNKGKEITEHSKDGQIASPAVSDNPPVSPQPSSAPVSPSNGALKTDSAKIPLSPAKEEIRSVRISVEKLDYLFNLIGELVLSRNRNIQLHRILSKRYPDDDTVTFDLTEAGSYLNQLTSEIQWAVMKTRMMPVSSVFSKFRRIVRDIAKNLGKEIDLQMTGEDTEIDKNIIEGIGDPLTHLIRNSADHGIEMPDEREKAGKPRTGCIKLDAYYEENSVMISIKDDGKGIDVNAIKRKALEKGLITAADEGNLSKQALLNLIFAPGLSTAQKVSAVSGRGVGMDVVKTNIEKLRGQILIDSDAGRGSEIKMKIPLTLAILDTLIVSIRDQRYAVSLSNVVETHRAEYGRIETVRGSMVFRMRNELLPLVLLADVFNLPYRYNKTSEVTIVVLKHGLMRMGLVVDKTSGQEEVVIKPLDCLDGLTEPVGISGATVLGDGSITFILDVDYLMKFAKAAETRSASDITIDKDIILGDTGTINVVLVDNLGKEQYAIPARNIREIELIHKTDIEDISGRLMIKHRGTITPLTTISACTGVPAQREFDRYYMVILHDPAGDLHKKAGLLVGRMLGIKMMEGSSINADSNKLKSVSGATIFNGRITLLLNIEEVTSSAFSENPVSLKSECPGPAISSNIAGRILVVDDVKTHRTILEEVVQKAGYGTVSAEDGLDALNKLNDKISLVLTDLEMPNMNGYELTKEAKKRYPGIPVIMVTSLAGEEDMAKGLEAGVDKYLVKWDKDALLQELKKQLYDTVGNYNY